jgi:hypothetical protein
MPEPGRTWGCRLSWSDAGVLAVASVLTWWLWPRIGSLVGILPMALGHFLLFCNVVRLARRRELLWAAACVANIAAWGLLGEVWWPGILATQTPLTALLIAREMRSPRYHGIMARRLNPHLSDWLEGRA